jgi:alpha-aminoadipic semialdehyde synthase
MRPPLTVGVLAETKNKWERRAPLTPQDVKWLVERKIPVEVLTSSVRVFSDDQYKKAGAKIVSRFQKAQLLVGVKEPSPEALLRDKVYFVFSHTMKGQSQNRPLLKAALRRRITLMDYEAIRDKRGNRLAYFGRFAGICGAIDCLHYLGKRLDVLGYPTPFLKVKKALDYGSFRKAKKHLPRVSDEIRRLGLPPKLCPFIIGVTGHGNVSDGAGEVLGMMRPIEVHPKDMKRFVRDKKNETRQIYKTVLLREEKLRSKQKRGFYFEEYLAHPERFESNLDRYLPYFSALINCSYWDKRYPRLVTEKMVKKLHKHKDFKLRLIADLSCDVNGSVEITKKITDPDSPSFIYDPQKGKVTSGLDSRGIAVTAMDNLPAEFPQDASEEFGLLIRDYIYQTALHGACDITHHHALPFELRGAVIAEGGRLTLPFRYLEKHIK